MAVVGTSAVGVDVVSTAAAVGTAAAVMVAAVDTAAAAAAVVDVLMEAAVDHLGKPPT